jgi:hypothetical protein
MQRTPRRKRACLKAGLYLALVGGDGDTDGRDATADPEPDDTQDDGPSPEE